VDAPVPQKILLLQARNLGDAVIGSGLVNSFGASFPDAELHLWTRPTFQDLFTGNPHVDRQHHAHFPMGTVKQFDARAAWRLGRILPALRRERFDLCVNTTGDFRENLLGWLVRPRANAAPVWAPGHRYRRLVRPGLLGLVNRPVPVPKEVLNVYEVRDHLARALGCAQILGPSLPVTPVHRPAGGPLRVGIHPYASQRSKLWPWENWLSLVRSLLRRGCAVDVFCAANERETVRRELAPVLSMPDVRLSVGPLREFFSRVAALDLLIALDSFSVHAAQALGVPSILLNGANDIALWTPPNSTALSKGEICPWFPCLNKPRCERTPAPFACMSALTVADVEAAVAACLATAGRP
jgi:heptosyltransferase-3